MAKVELKYVNSYTDRHGKPRHYFRRGREKQIALPGEPGSKAFMEAYAAARDGVPPAPEILASRTRPGSLSALVVAYYQSGDFRVLAESTQSTRRNQLDRLRERHGDKPIARLEPRHVRGWLDAKAGTPEAANNLRKVLRQLMRFGVERGFLRTDPTAGVRPLKTRSGGHRTWSEEEIATFEAHWPAESRERLAFALLLYTGVRKSDVVVLGRQHVRAGKIHVLPMKTARTSATRVALPIHPALQLVMDAHPLDRLTFLQTQAGTPFTPAGFGNFFHDARKAAALPAGLTAHGLRKGMGRRLAEAGATAHEIMAVLTHTTLEEAELYTRAANRDRLAASAFERIGG